MPGLPRLIMSSRLVVCHRNWHRFWVVDGQPGGYPQDGLSESQASAVNRGTMYLKTEAASASGNGRLQRSMETIDRYVPNVLRSSSHFRVAKSAHPLIRCSSDRCVGRSWSNACNSFVPRFSRAPDMGSTVAQIFAQKQAYAAQ
jgi:hypothetical protein